MWLILWCSSGDRISRMWLLVTFLGRFPFHWNGVTRVISSGSRRPRNNPTAAPILARSTARAFHARSGHSTTTWLGRPRNLASRISSRNLESRTVSRVLTVPAARRVRPLNSAHPKELMEGSMYRVILHPESPRRVVVIYLVGRLRVPQSNADLLTRLSQAPLPPSYPGVILRGTWWRGDKLNHFAIAHSYLLLLFSSW